MREREHACAAFWSWRGGAEGARGGFWRGGQRCRFFVVFVWTLARTKNQNHFYTYTPQKTNPLHISLNHIHPHKQHTRGYHHSNTYIKCSFHFAVFCIRGDGACRHTEHANTKKNSSRAALAHAARAPHGRKTTQETKGRFENPCGFRARFEKFTAPAALQAPRPPAPRPPSHTPPRGTA
jgi:hypothetical protein